MFDNFDKKC